MGRCRRRACARAFTLVEMMIVVALIGVLSLVAVVSYHKWVKHAARVEAHDILEQIREQQEHFLAENGVYLNVTGSIALAAQTQIAPAIDYPLKQPGKSKTQWGAACTWCTNDWSKLNVNVTAPVIFGYALQADNAAAPPAITINGTAFAGLASMAGAPWFVAEADGDLDGTGQWTSVYAISGTNQLYVDGEGR